MRDLEQVGQIIEELVRRANADPRDYRPWGARFDRKPTKRAKAPAKKRFVRPGKNFVPLQGQQMSLFPCADLFPEAYQ